MHASSTFLDVQRVYGSYTEMAVAEAALRTTQRLDFVVIVTPNDQHLAPARLFLESGFNVICDKPVALDVAEAEVLHEVVNRTRKVFVLTYNYAGNAMVKEAWSPEGYLEAFANLHREAFRAISAEVEGRPMPPNLDFPTIDDGVAGMRFVESAVESARRGSKWVTLP